MDLFKVLSCVTSSVLNMVLINKSGCVAEFRFNATQSSWYCESATLPIEETPTLDSTRYDTFLFTSSSAIT
ncbi:hypothetical protein OGAPHI_002994 [Ogataea philodendri]|uniref:Uncharacterized protein n=1 Tax=Ogataea philodendri TaxID=1378263 RepID=A0A9P8P983_9ASCO|nr:uncharacterized protein OGAPHI_002994 [Ogataea philodendri]KAH3667345.1 hypothetical protein OGAPHI_002994 [Ogataea philodendri]